MVATSAKSRGGRPKGSRSKSTIEREARIAAATAALTVTQMDGMPTFTVEQIRAMSPIEIMQFAAVVEACAGRWLAAADLASKLAPYTHARLTSTKIDATVRRGVGELSDDELMALAGDGEGEGEGEGGIDGEDCGEE